MIFFCFIFIRAGTLFAHLIGILKIQWAFLIILLLQVFDDIIFAFFTLELSIKMVAMGVYGHGTYLADSWNRLDFFIVMAGYVACFI